MRTQSGNLYSSKNNRLHLMPSSQKTDKKCEISTPCIYRDGVVVPVAAGGRLNSGGLYCVS